MDDRLFGSLEWRNIGPHRGERCVAVAGHPTDVGTFYFGACAGGVFKTTNGGSHWWNISDGFFDTAAVGAIAVSDSDPSIIYVGTGESQIRSNVSHGDCVDRSDDYGQTRRNLGLTPTRHISRVLIHPKNPDVVYVAALGHAWGPNPERGVYRSTNGGESWDLVLHKSDRAGAADLTIDPRNPRTLYAAIWQGRRYPYAAESGGPDSGIWRSTDGGDTWTELTRNPGLPTGLIGRVGVSASPAQPGRVWALVEAEDGAMFRSDDYGDTWEKLSADADLRRRPWYYMHAYADPQDPNTVWVLNLDCWRSLDAGKTFEKIPTPHGDNHGLWIDPRNSNRMIEGNDGGACVTFDGGHTWSSLLNQPTAQFYHVTTDDKVPYGVYGSQQDNWAMRVPSLSFEGAISWRDYIEPGGGESGYIAISKEPPYTVFGGGIGTGLGHGRLIAWNPETGQKRNITPWPEVFGMGAGADSLKYRFQWTFPVETSPHDDSTLYICSNYVHRSTDDGSSWETISPDLTRNDPTKIGPSGGPITADNSGAEIYCTIFAFRESPHERGVFWAGSDDGLIHISRDGGATWQNVTPPELPEWAMISVIEPSPHDAATAYVAATCYKFDDLRPYLFRTNDYGATWTRITAGIPDDEFTRVIREDPNRRGLLYCGTERGIFVSFDDGANWQWLKSNLPITPIWDLVVKGTDVRPVTNKPEKKSTDEAQAAPAEGEVQQVTGEEEVSSEEEAEEQAPWAPNEAGMNNLVWDYRYDKPVKVQGKSRGSREEALESVGGPRAVPGDYQVRLTVGDQTLEQGFRVLADPRLPVSAEDLKAQFELKLAIRDRTSETNTAINQIRLIRQQVEDWEKRAGDRAQIKDAAKSLKDQLRSIEAELINVDFEKPRPGPNRIKEKLDALSSMIDESDHAPTRGAHEVYDLLRGQLETQLARLRELIDGPINAFNQLLRSLDVPPVGV